MFYEPLYTLSPEMISSSPLPNIHPQDIDCIIRSQIPNKGSLYVSNIQGVQNIPTIKKLKVSSILTCAEGYKLDHPYQLIPLYKYLPLPEYPCYNLNDYLDEATQFIKTSLSVTNCIVHCLTGSGNGKSIIVLIAFLMKHYMMNYQDALLYIKRKRKLVILSFIQPNLQITITPEYQQTLKQYEIHIKERKSSFNFNPKTENNTIRYKTNKSNFMENQQRLKSGMNEEDTKSRQRTNQRMKSYLSIPENNQEDRLVSQCSHISVKNSHSRVRSSSQIHSQKTVSDYHNKSGLKEQKSKLIVQTINLKEPKPQHKEAIYFDKILSSNHQEYIGVKRDLKNSSITQSKHIAYTVDGSPILQLSKSKQNQLRIQAQHDNSKHLKTSRVSKSLDNKSQRSNNLNKSISHISNVNKSKIITQNSQFLDRQEQKSVRSNRSSRVKKTNYNPQDEQCSPEQKIALQLQKSQISPSKRTQFLDINKELNQNINLILTQYDKQFTNLRDKYHNRLRNLRVKANETAKKSVY